MIIKLCGSARFEETFNFVQVQLENLGHTVYALTDLGFGSNLSKDQANRARLMEHFVGSLKLELSDAIVIINENGYIGAHTAIEAFKAKSLGKRIFYFSPSLGQQDYRDLYAFQEYLVNSEEIFLKR